MFHSIALSGPHREMAVDVPDSFIARNKTPPRYPPPRPPAQTQVNYTPNLSTSAKQPLLSASSTTSSLKSAASSTNIGGISLDLQPSSFTTTRLDSLDNTQINNNNNNTTNTTTTNNHSIINSNHHNHHQNNNNNHHTKNSSSFDSCIEFGKKSSSKCPSSLGSVCESIGFDSMSYRTKSRGSLSTRSSSSGELGPPEYDLGPHREMAVDVPDNFVGVSKAPPRLPRNLKSNHSIGAALKETPTTNNSTSTLNEKDAIHTTATNSQTNINNTTSTTPQTTKRNNEVFFSFFFVFHLHLQKYFFIISFRFILCFFII